MKKPSSKSYKLERMLHGTQEEVAKLLGVSRETIARRETGVSKVSHEAMSALLALPLKKAPEDYEKRKASLLA